MAWMQTSKRPCDAPQAECYDYLFECAIKLRSLGIDTSKPSPVMPQPVTGEQQANGHAGMHLPSV
jgi:hypothetical protein